MYLRAPVIVESKVSQKSKKPAAFNRRTDCFTRKSEQKIKEATMMAPPLIGPIGPKNPKSARIDRRKIDDVVTVMENIIPRHNQVYYSMWRLY